MKTTTTKNYKSFFITIGIVLTIIIIAYFSLKNPSPPLTDEELVKCIGENSILYSQLGCSHCEIQEELFGDNIQYINKIDCFYEPEKCEGVEGTPSWKINDFIYIGVKTIEELKELTKC